METQEENYLFTQKKRFKDTIKKELNKRILIDNLIQEIYRDTIRFDEKDIVFTQIGRRNINSYSMLYVINGIYLSLSTD